MCVNHSIGKAWMKSGLATLGSCTGGSSKVESIYSSQESYYVYPNPNSGMFTVDYQLDNDADVSLAVTDLMGNVLLSKRMKVKGSDIYSDEIDMTNFENAVYILVIIIDGKTTSKRIQLIR